MNTASDRYTARFRKVLDYIDAHLSGDVSVERLSAVVALPTHSQGIATIPSDERRKWAALSKHHFHRQFTEICGIGVYKYVSCSG